MILNSALYAKFVMMMFVEKMIFLIGCYIVIIKTLIIYHENFKKD